MQGARERKATDHDAHQRRRPAVHHGGRERAGDGDDHAGAHVHPAQVEHVLGDREANPHGEAVDRAVDEVGVVGTSHQPQQDQRLEDLLHRRTDMRGDGGPSDDRDQRMVHEIGESHRDGAPRQRGKNEVGTMRLEEVEPLHEIQEQQRNDARDEDGVNHRVRRTGSRHKQKAVVVGLPL